jgi:hypothetical protein
MTIDSTTAERFQRLVVEGRAESAFAAECERPAEVIECGELIGKSRAALSTVGIALQVGVSVVVIHLALFSLLQHNRRSESIS